MWSIVRLRGKIGGLGSIDRCVRGGLLMSALLVEARSTWHYYCSLFVWGSLPGAGRVGRRRLWDKPNGIASNTQIDFDLTTYG